MAEKHGTKLADIIAGLLEEENLILGHGGDDAIEGGKHADLVRGGKGSDTIVAGRGEDNVYGDTGDDSIKGTVGNDTVRGGQGNDTLSGGKDHDVLAGGWGDDKIEGNSGDDALSGGSGNDRLYGSAGNDWLFGGKGNDAVYGGSGDDVVVASSGQDVYSGGAGHDELDFSLIAGRLDIDLGKHTAKAGSGKAIVTDFVSGFEIIIGTNGADKFMGDRNSTHLIGGSGDDWFRGKLGSDTLTGGDGRDTYAFLKKDTAGGATDTVTDFEIGTDRLDLRDFTKGKASTANEVRFLDAATGTTVQGKIGAAWVDVVTLKGIDVHDVGYDILS